MKHLLASCAVVALMAAPALAQSTNPPNDPFSDTDVVIDPATPEVPDVSIDADVDAQSDVTVSMAPETDDEAVAETETDLDTAGDSEMAAETAADDVMFQAEVENPDTQIAETETGADVGTEMSEAKAASVPPVEPPVDVAELPDEYSSEDLNALMLAQLNDQAEENASISFVSDTDTFAETDTGVEADASTDLAMTEAAPAAEAPVEDYASSASDTYDTTEPSMEPSDEAAIEDYAASQATAPEGLPVSPDVDSAMTPVAPALEADEAEMADATDDTILMAEQEDGDVMIAQGDIDQNAVEIAASDPRFSTLVELVGLAGLEDELSMNGPYTVFAPTNEAFAALPEETLARLKTEEGKAELTEILKAHVVEGAVMAPDVPLTGEEVETLAATTESITGSTDGSLNINGSNTIGDGIYASNGVVYALDAVILPDATVEPASVDADN
jgi:uncharacterized surface protein with fasciclin (FAS1) repeats